MRERAARLAAALRAARRAARHDGERDAAQHAGDGGGALRGAGAQRGAEYAQHPPRRAAARLADAALRDRGADHRPRVCAGRCARRCASCATSTAARRSSSTSATASIAGAGERLGALRIRGAAGRARAAARLCTGRSDEWDAIAVSYTSGTTGDPKGVVTHHRGAYLNAVCQRRRPGRMPHFPKYLWTLPMFHCNGWCFPWTVALLGGTHVCLRKVEARRDLRGDARARRRSLLRRAHRAQPADQRAIPRCAPASTQRCAAWSQARRRLRR